jgi:Zn-finger nucleic acid-binding protein
VIQKAALAALAADQVVAVGQRGVGEMKCPKCKNVSLKSGKVSAKKLILDQCSRCKGMWFDRGELATLLGARADKQFDTDQFSVKVAGLECPRCELSLYEFCYPGTLTLIDACKKCDGVWLDNNEWKSISHSRGDSNKITCPKCDLRQNPAESCVKCGVIIKKYQLNDAEKNSQSVSDKNSHLAGRSESEASYADGIPGLKGKLLRKIDRVIQSLT